MKTENKHGLVFGLKCGEQLGSYDPDSSSLKMSERLLFEGLTKCLVRLPKSGMIANGKILEQATWVHRIKGKGSGLWPTPDCSDRRSMKSKQQGLSNKVKLLEMQKAENFPTPTARDYRGSFADNSEAYQKRKNHPRGVNLAEEIQRRNNGSLSGQLNPEWVEFLMNYPKGWTDLEKKIELTFNIPCSELVSNQITEVEINGTAKKIRPGKILQSLRESIASEEISNHNRGYDCFQETGILQSKMHGKGNDEKKRYSFGNQGKSGKAKGGILRRLQNKKQVANSSQGLKSLEQSSEQSPNIMCDVPYEMALESRQKTKNKNKEFQLQDLWSACSEIGYVPTTLSEIPKIWQSLTIEEKDWIALRIDSGDAWHSDWPNTPRLSIKTKNRVNRLKGLGNSIVPQIAELLFRLIKELL